MANWNKLNQEYKTTIDSLTDTDWKNWVDSREAKKLMRRREMELKASLQAEKLYLSGLSGKSIMSQPLMSFEQIQSVSVVGGLMESLVAGENSYAMAA